MKQAVLEKKMERIQLIKPEAEKKIKVWRKETNRKTIANAIKQLQAIGKDNRVPSKKLMDMTGIKDSSFYLAVAGAKKHLRLEGFFLRSGGRPKGYYIVSNKEDSIEPLTFDMSVIRSKTFQFIDLWKAAMYHFSGSNDDKREIELLRRKIVEAVMGW